MTEVVLIPCWNEVIVDPAPPLYCTTPETSQSPAVKLMLVALNAVPLVSDVPLVVLVTNSPTDPAFALSFVVVPTMPAVEDGVIAPVA